MDRVPDLATLLSDSAEDVFTTLLMSEGSGRPAGSADFVADLERRIGRRIARWAPGRKPREPVVWNGVIGIASTY